jgi:hypothetical protein
MLDPLEKRNVMKSLDDYLNSLNSLDCSVNNAADSEQKEHHEEPQHKPQPQHLTNGKHLPAPTSNGKQHRIQKRPKSLSTLRGTPAYEMWLDGLVAYTNLETRAFLIRNALREFAERHGYHEPRPKR